MLSLLVLILLFIYMYKKRASYNPYDVKYSHSSYYECSFTKRETCTEEILDILRPVAGHKRILTNLCLTDESGRTGGADVVMIHESGIYVIYSGNFPGVISGNPEGRYWIQSFREGRLLSCRNYLYNPFLENKRILDRMQWELKDMPWLPYYSIAVFGRAGMLATAGYMGENRFALPVYGLSAAVADIFRHNRRFLKLQDIERVCGRLEKL
ncbi:nuclease-related domain-containing protein [Eisenbergiella sp.]